MRPAQKAPENLGDEDGRSLGIGRFNEAGAKSAGKPTPNWLRRSHSQASMRPAQKAPENPRQDRHARRPVAASMRPAQKAPENWTVSAKSVSASAMLQ